MARSASGQVGPAGGRGHVPHPLVQKNGHGAGLVAGNARSRFETGPETVGTWLQVGVSLGGSGEASVTGGMAVLAESGWAVSAESPSKVGQDRSSADSRRSTRFSVQNQDLSSAVTFADGVRPLAVGSAELKGGLRWAYAHRRRTLSSNTWPACRPSRRQEANT